MADTKISGLTALTGANVDSSTDLLAIVDTSVTTTKKITIDEFDNALWLKTAHTLGANYTATRAAGTVASGTVALQTNASTATGDSGGTSVIRANTYSLTTSGANAIASSVVHLLGGTHAGSDTVSFLYGGLSQITVSSTGAVTSAYSFASEHYLSSSGNITNAIGFLARAATFSSTGAITSNYGFRSNDIGHATLITNSYCFSAADQTASATLSAGFHGAVAAGTGKYNLYMVGTGQNYLAGITGIGIAASSSAALTLAASTTSVASLRISHGSAPTSPVNGDMWTTTSGLFVRINGTTKTVTLT